MNIAVRKGEDLTRTIMNVASISFSDCTLEYSNFLDIYCLLYMYVFV